MRTLALSILLVGCGSDGGGNMLDDLDPASLSADPVVAKSWIELSSAPMALYFGEMPTGLANLYAEATTPCPTETVTGDVTTYQGGCTDGDEHEWLGTATLTGSPSSDFFYGDSIVYDGFQVPASLDCGAAEYDVSLVFNGSITIEQASDGGGTFDIDLTYEGDMPDPANSCQPRHAVFALTYQGSVRPGAMDHDGDGHFDDWHWNGTGKLGSAVTGAVTLTTTDEYLNHEVCEDEALSGTTTIAAGSHTIAVAYDGQSDCDAIGTVTWSFDGADQGELEGISCDAGGRPGGALILLALIGLVRRRAR